MDDDEIECLDNDGTTICGYLTRPVKNGKTLGFRRKRFYKLDGAVLSKHANKGSPASREINVQGAEIKEIGKLIFAITVKDKEKVSAYDFENEMLVLSARTEKECGVWVSALRAAVQRRLKQHYEVGRVIGEGGFALVRIGRCLKTKELRAIKTLRKDDSYAKLQGREIAIIKNTNHPNIVKTFDVFETKIEIHIVMEFMSGGMLYDAIEDGIRFAEADVVQFMKEILDGIMYLHGEGIVHRDLKPENILCTNRTAPLHVKISDFGLSCITNVADLKANQVLMSTMTGTPEFIAPEIARQEPYTEKVDMWALGMLCYNVIAGTLPIDETRDVTPQLQNGVNLTFQENIWGSYSPEARSFLRALLCTEPQKRLSPLGCMVHPWLERDRGRASTKVGAHGRVSHRISRMNLATGDGRNALRLGGASRRKTTAIRPRILSGKKRWKTAYLAVSAANRLKWLITPRETDKVNELSSYDSQTNTELMDDLGNDSDEETSPSSASFAFFMNAAGTQRHPSLPSPKNRYGASSKTRISQDCGPQSLSALQEVKSSSSGAGTPVSGMTGWRDKGKSGTTRDGVSSTKKYGRGKERTEIVGGLSPLRKVSRKLTAVADNAGILGSLRKLSRKITAGGKKSKEDVTDDEDLELSLAELGVTDVDEGDLLLLEDEEVSSHGVFKSKLSKGMNSSHSVGDMESISPVTPSSGRSVQDGRPKLRKRG